MVNETIADAAKIYQPTTVKNIAELPFFELNTLIQDATGTDDSGKNFFYKYIEMNGEKYRVPMIVLGQLRDLLEANPNVKKVKVKKTGTGLQTRYTTIPLN